MIGEIAEWVLWATLFYTIAYLAIAVAAAFGWLGNEDPKFSDIKTWLWFLLKRGYDGETILFRHQRTGRFVRFVKYLRTDSFGGLILTFPEVGWGRDYVPRLKAYCEQRGLGYRASTADGAGEPGFARIECGGDLKEALALSKTIWNGFYGYGEHERHSRELSNFSTSAELTAFPPLVPSRTDPIKWMNRYTDARLKHVGLAWLGHHSYAATFFVAGMAFFISLIGLPVSTLSSIGDQPGWHVALGSVQAQGNNTTLVFFLVYSLSYAALSLCQRVPLIQWHEQTRAEKIVNAPKRLLFLTIPVAVVVVWLSI